MSCNVRQAPIALQRFILLLLLLLSVWGFMGLPGLGSVKAVPDPTADSMIAGTDIALYQQVIHGVAAGRDYYEALRDGLIRWDFPLTPVFNWRTPLNLTVQAMLGAPASIWLLRLGALAAILLGLRSQGSPLKRVGIVLIAAISLLPLAVEPAIFMAEPWAGVWLAVATGLYAARQPVPAALAAVLALFWRELAAPFCVAATLLALIRGRRREFSVWCAAFVAYMLYYGWHVQQVLPLIPDNYAGTPRSWLVLGGLTQLMSTLQWFSVVIIFKPFTGFILGTVLIGLLPDGDSSLETPRAALAITWLFFMVAGHPFDAYWGLIAVGILAWIFPAGVATLACLIRSSLPWPRRAAQVDGIS